MGLEPGEGGPVYLELADALELYAAIIGGTVTQAGDQLRDRAGLEGALGRPRSYAHYEDADVALQAAVLAHGIAESQTFIDVPGPAPTCASRSAGSPPKRASASKAEAS